MGPDRRGEQRAAAKYRMLADRRRLVDWLRSDELNEIRPWTHSFALDGSVHRPSGSSTSTGTTYTPSRFH
jgi:hypothetical protein